MILDTENISISLSKYKKKHEKSPEFMGSVYDHEKKEEVATAFGRTKEWSSGDKYIRIQIVEMQEKPNEKKSSKFKEDEDLPF